MQKVIHNRDNLHIVFDYLDKLYCETSEINEYKSSNLFKIHYPWFFKDLIKTFIDYNSQFTYLEATGGRYDRLKLPLSGREEGLCYDNRRIQKTEKHKSGTSSFNPVLCDVIYKWFIVPNSFIYDPFAGGIVRGGVAAMLGHNYIGIDINYKQVLINIETFNNLKNKYNIHGNAEYYYGDSCIPIKDSDLSDGYDLIFTCPPYYNLEKYTDEEDDLSNCKTYTDFINKYRNAREISYTALKDDCFCVIVVSDIRNKETGEYYGFVADNIKICQDIGFKFYNEIILYNDTGNLAITSGNYLDKARKVGRQHQNVLVFYKGNTKNIKEKFGSVV